MPFTKQSATDDITRECLAGATPAELIRLGYPEKSCYRIYNKLEAEGKLPGGPSYGKEDNKDDVDPFKLAEPDTRVRQIVPTKQQVQATTPGAKVATGVSEIDKIRGVVGIYDQPKVLYMERPELLYIAMAMSLHYWGWSQMSTSDFIDTVLDDYIRASGKEYNVIIDTGRLGELVSFAKERGFNFWEEQSAKEEEKADTESELPNEVVKLAKELEERESEEAEEQDSEELLENTESNVEEEPHKPTIGELLSRLHISNIQKNIQKEVKNDSSETI